MAQFSNEDEIIKLSSARINNFSTPLINILDNGKKNPRFILQGSGTFVRINNIFGILTAYHVAEQLRLGDCIGINVYPDDRTQRFFIPTKTVTFINIGDRETKEFGPDIAFIKLPNNLISTLKANKSFYDLALHENNFDTIKENLTKSDTVGFCGNIGLLTRDEEPDLNFDEIKSFQGFFGITFIKEKFNIENFDYLDLDIDFNMVIQDFPKSFRGVSGGGIWKLIIELDDKKELILKDIIYCGLVFYETPLENDNHRVLRGHGLETIYAVMLTKIQE